jgi:signal transduction histidine kinase
MLRIKKQYDELEANLRLREDLVQMIMHDIKSPLTAILGYSSLLLISDTMSAKDLQDVEKLETQAHRLDTYLNDVLIMAKMEAGHLILNRSPVDVVELVQAVKQSHEVMAQSKKIKFVVDTPAESQEILLDANLFSRVLDNLVSNALKFSPAESTITVQVEYSVNGPAETQPPESGLCLKVFDEGPGIAAEHRDRIFDKFEIVALDQQGVPQVGLGLAFCKLVVEAHAGRIFMEPNQPVGSVFVTEI